MTFFEQLISNSWCIFSIFIGIMGVQFVIAFHELGHWLFCKLFNIRTPSFSIGFGPRLFTKKIGDTTFALSAIPLGGYVEIAGAAEIGQGDQLEAFSNDQESFEQKPYYQKLLVMLGGILFNIIFAFTVFLSLWLFEMPKSLLFYPESSIPVIGEIRKDSPAEKFKLKIGQEITKFNSISITNTEQLLELIKKAPNQKVILTIKEQPDSKNSINTQEHTQEVILGNIPGDLNTGSLGAIYELTNPAQAKNFIEALVKSWNLTIKVITRTAEGLLSAISRRSTEGMGGPLRLFSDASEHVSKGAGNLFLLLAIISIGLAVLNLIPLPIFDGGQVLTYSLEALLGRKLNETIKHNIHLVSWILVLILILYLTLKDTLHIWSRIYGQ